MRSIRLYVSLFVLFTAVAAVAQHPPLDPPGLDGKFVRLARKVPGFGGYFFDANGDLNVYLTDLVREPAARAAVADVARNRPERSKNPWTRPAVVIVRRSDFDFEQLGGWRVRLSGALDMPGVQTLDADEVANRIRVGVTDDVAKEEVLSVVDQLGVPRNAVIVEIVPQGSLITTLQQYYRPLVGGLEITDGTVYSQGGSQIGQEAYDPGFFTSAQNSLCPANHQCRWSDVAFVAYDAGVNRQQGALAQTLYRGTGGSSGSLDIGTVYPTFTLYSTATPVSGSYLDKVGRTTGWTSGPVGQTCMDQTVIFTTTRILCQDEVEVDALPGDSGSPVFQWTGQTTGAFAGIVWYRTGLGSYLFSHIDRIEEDMGNGVTYGPN